MSGMFWLHDLIVGGREVCHPPFHTIYGLNLYLMLLYYSNQPELVETACFDLLMWSQSELSVSLEGGVVSETCWAFLHCLHHSFVLLSLPLPHWRALIPMQPPLPLAWSWESVFSGSLHLLTPSYYYHHLLLLYLLLYHTHSLPFICFTLLPLFPFSVLYVSASLTPPSSSLSFFF